MYHKSNTDILQHITQKSVLDKDQVLFHLPLCKLPILIPISYCIMKQNLLCYEI